MDISDERRKKLEAGKEKLAAFRKKKAKSKKTTKDGGEDLNLKDVESLNGDAINPPHAQGFVQPSQLNDDIYNLAHGEEFFPEVPEARVSVPCETQPHQEISNSQDVAEGAPITTESIVMETMEQSVNQQNTNSNCSLDLDGFKMTDPDPCPDMEETSSDVQQALAQRDKLIGQLTHSLKSNSDQQAEKEELVSQVLTLSQQVTQLQTQLKEADNTLQEQLQLHGMSGSALQSAKTQMLQLQSIVHNKDNELVLASQLMEKNHQTLYRSNEENARLLQSLNDKEEELGHLQQSYEAAVSSHEEKQEKEESEKSHQLFELQREWKQRETDLNATLESREKEIEGWRKCEQEWKEREFQLQQNYEHLVNRVQQEETGREERLKTLEQELEQLRKQNEEVVTEASALKMENEQKNSSLSRLENLADEHLQLSSLHSSTADECQSLKSANSVLEESLAQLNVENEAMRSQLEELTAKLAEEQEKLNLSQENQADLASKHSLECDTLNNKINELQSDMSQAHATVAKTFEEEKEAVRILQQEILAKQSAHENSSQELESMLMKNSELQSVIESKDSHIRELENVLQGKVSSEETLKNAGVEEKMKLEECVDNLTKELKEFKDECDRYGKQVEQLEKERLSSTENLETLNEELERKGESLVRESDRCKRLETQLQMVEEERGVLNANIQALNGEIDSLKHDLANERLQVDIVGEELVSVTSQLVDSQNVMQNISDEHKELVKGYRSDIDKLQEKVGSFTDLDSKLISSSQEVDVLSADLKDAQQSLEAKTKDCEELFVEVENLREGEKASVSKIKDLENEIVTIEQKHQEVTDKEVESLQNQEELQRQLESTVAQWQKLQLIVQEKEIELQNLHDDLDEQKRICSTMKRNHEDYLSSVQSDVDDLKEEKEIREAHISELEDQLAGVHQSLAAKDVELSDTMTRVEAVGVSSQNLAAHLSEKEKEMDAIIGDKERFLAELSDKERDISSLKEEMSKADNEITHLSEALEVAKTELSSAYSKGDETDSLLKCLEEEKKALSDKVNDLALQVEGLDAQLVAAHECTNKIAAENGDLKSAINEMDGLLMEERVNKEELEKLLDREKQNNNRILGTLSSLHQDVESKEERLVVNSATLEEKVTELSRKEEELVRGSEELHRLNEELEKVKNDIEANEAELALTSGDKDSLVDRLQQRELEIDRLTKDKEELSSNVQHLTDTLKEVETNIDKQTQEVNDLNMQVTHLQNNLKDKDTHLSSQEEQLQTLNDELNAELRQSLTLKSALSSFSTDVQDKEDSLIQHSVLLEEKVSALSLAEAELCERDCTIRELEEKTTELDARLEELSSKELCLQTEVAALRGQVDKHEADLTEMSAINRELSESQIQLEQDVKRKEGDNSNLKQDNDILHKECCDLRADLQEKENKNLDLVKDVDSLKSAIETSNEEKEMLKNNFDACLEEMHQKSSAQDMEMGRLKSKMAEDSRCRDQGQEEMKEVYSQQMNHLEDKLMEMEREKSLVEKEVREKESKLDRVKDDYEQQISEIEMSLHAAQADVTKMKESMSKVSTDHDNELTDLKSLHELQMSELMENYLTLEKSMSDVQRSLSDQAETMRQERMEMEQSFESLMSEMDERKRRSDSDINRLKKQLDEMNKDHEREMKALEKRYETQLFDLEDRCSVTSSELERMRNSVVGVEGDFVQERRRLENKIGDLENVRRDLEIKCTILEDDLALVKEQSNMREEEVKSILQTAAEKQSGMRYEMEDLEETVRMLKMDSESSRESMKREFESRMEDVNAENEHLKTRLKSFEMNAELDMEMKGHEGEKDGEEDLNSKLEEMKKQMTALTDENLSLKRRLLGYKSLEKKVRLLSSGVEDVRLPLEEPMKEELILPAHMKIVTSTPSKKNYEDDEQSFSPTAEEVSLIEGFVSETHARPVSSHRFEKMRPQQSADEEADFVVEEEDSFQPELDDFGDGPNNRNVHPIKDNEVAEWFQPELSDQFFAEAPEDSNNRWPLELSVGLSPTPADAPQLEGFFDDEDGVQENFESTDAKLVKNEIDPMPEQVSDMSLGDGNNDARDELVEKQMKQMEEDLEEKYAFELRKQKQDVIHEYESKYENMEKELEQHFAQKEQSVKHDWELKFAKALKKMKKDFEKKLKKQSANPEGGLAGADKEHEVDSNQEENDEVPEIEEGKEGLGGVVEQLSKENQELAEVRDELLKQIEISQARGRHSRVQHQLQSMLSEREKDNTTSSQNMSLSSNDDCVEPEIVQAESVPSCTSKPCVPPLFVDVQTNSGHVTTESAERSPTVDAERILEDIEQQSSQDLPLEWELTNTIPVETDASSESVPGQHQSVWEVFGSRCNRQDCVEVRNRYRRLCQCVVTSFGIGEELMSDESGLFQLAGRGDCEDGDQEDGCRRVAGGLKGLMKSEDKDNNPDDDDDEEVDELFADNVALESELLSLAENMVLYKDAFMNKKSELDKENEFLRLELETECKSRHDEEEKFDKAKEEMECRISDLEDQLSCVKTQHNEAEEVTDQEVMTDGPNGNDIDLVKTELEEKMNAALKEKQKIIDSLQMEMDYFKSQFEEEIGDHKENTDTKIKALEEELLDLKTENNYLCLTHEGKEETITRLISEMGQSVFERDSMNESLSEKESKLLDLFEKLSDLTERNDMLEPALLEKEEEILSLGSEVRTMKSELQDRSNQFASKEKHLKAMEKEIETLTNSNKDLQSILTKKESLVTDLNKKVIRLKAELKDKTKTTSVTETELGRVRADLKDQIDRMQSVLDAKDEEIESQNRDVKTLTSQLEDSVKNSSGIIETLESKIATLEGQSNQLQKDLQEKDTVVATLNSEVTKLRSDKEDREGRISENDRRMQVLENELGDKEDIIASLQSICGKWTKTVKAMKMKAEETKDNIACLRQENDRLHQQVEERESCQSTSSDTLKILEGQVSQLQEEKSDLLSNVETKQERISILEAEVGSLNPQLQDLKQENDKLNRKLEEQESCHSSSSDALKTLEDQVSNLQEEKKAALSDIESKQETILKYEIETNELNSQLTDLKQEKDRLISRTEDLEQELLAGKDTLRMLEEELASVKEDNDNLQSILEAKNENMSKSELEIDSLGSELNELSSRLADLQKENQTLSTLQDEVGDLKDQRDILLADQKDKENIIAELNEEIDGLKAQLVEFEKKLEESNQQKDIIQPVEAELVSECYSGSVSSGNFVNSDENPISEPDIVEEDKIIPVTSGVAEQAEGSRTSSQSQTEGSANRDVVDSVASPLCVSTSSITADQASMMSSTSIEDQALAEELNQLKKDLRETKAIYSRENSLLHEALEREKRVKDFVMNKNDAESNVGTEGSQGDHADDGTSEVFNPETDMFQRLAVCLEQNKMLEEENGKLRTKIRKQEAVVLIYKHRLSEKEHDSELWRKSLTGQLQALQKQRDDLVQLLRNQEMGLSNSCPTISEAIGQAALKEESLRRVQDDLMEKMEELDHLHQMLTQRQVELQHCDMERKHLEQLCVLKDQTEMQLMKQKRLMEEQVSEIEHRLKERETMLAEEKSRLLEEMKEKDDRLLQMSQPQSPRSPLAASTPNRSFSMGDLSSPVGAAMTPFGVDLNSSAEEADQHHLKAIETLREKLRLEYSVRSSRLAESQASTVASYWMRRQSSKDGSQNLDP